LTGNFSPVIPSFTNRGLSCRLTWSASGEPRFHCICFRNCVHFLYVGEVYLLSQRRIPCVFSPVKGCTEWGCMESFVTFL
jgi:hypothetical protein